MDSEAILHELIEKAKGGDRKAFDLVVETLSHRLEAAIRRQVGARLAREVEVNDLVQETFLQAWRSLGEYQWAGEASLWAWLNALARNVILMEARKLKAKKRAAEGQVSLQEHVCTPGGGFGELLELLKKSATSPSNAMRRDERFQRLREALAHLSPDHRRVIFLARVRELHTDEVARRMGRSPEAVSMLLYRALVKLKTAFGSTGSFHLPDRTLQEEDHG